MVARSSGGKLVATGQTFSERMNSPTTQRKGLVSRRVDYYESSPTKPYHHRTQDSFHVRSGSSSKSEEVDTRQDEKHNYRSYTYSRENVQASNSDNPGTTTEKGECDQQSLRAFKGNSSNYFVGSAFVTRGVDHHNKGELSQAEEAFSNALSNQRASLGNTDIYVALTLSNLGAVYLEQNRVDEARKALEESLEMKRRLNPNLMVADTLNNLGSCAYIQGDLKKGLFYYTSALKELKNKGGESKDIANALFNIGRLEIQLREWMKALKDLEMACALTREIHGTHHPFVAETLDLIGFVHLCTNNFDNAMVSFSGALAIHRRLRGTINPEIANSLVNVGMVREAKGDLPEAMEAFTTARDLFSRTRTSEDHPGFKAARRSITNLELDMAKRNRKKLIQKHNKALFQVKAKPSQT